MIWMTAVCAVTARPAVTAAQAQPEPVLYVGAALTKGYVVGAPVAASGLLTHGEDTLWTSAGLKLGRVNGIAFVPGQPDRIFAAAGNGVLRTLDGGGFWRVTTGWEVTEVNGVAVDPNRPDHVYLASAYGVWRSEDGAETWIESNTGLKETFTQVVRVDHSRPGHLLVATEGGLARSTDGARSWSPVGPQGVAIRDIAQSRTDPARWIAASSGQGVLLSGDGGATWRRASGRIADESLFAVAVDPADPDRMAASGWNTGVYVSTDGGRRWTKRGERLPVPHVMELAYDPRRPGRLWAATIEEGLFYSDDGGRRWTYAGLDGAMIYDLAFIGEAK